MIDKETSDILNESEKIERFIDSEGWKIVKKKLFDKLITLDSISGVPKNKSSDDLLKDFMIREGVVSMIIEWVKDIEGEAVKSKHNKKFVEQLRKESILQYFD